MSTGQPYPVHEPRPQHSPSARIPDGSIEGSKSAPAPKVSFKQQVAFLDDVISRRGDFSDMLSEDKLSEISQDCLDEWRQDTGSLEKWRKTVERGLDLAAQDVEETYGSNFPWEGSSNIRTPILTQATQQWAARAYPELIRGDEVVRAKIITQPSKQPSAQQALGAAAPSPQQMSQQPPQQVQAATQDMGLALQTDQQADNLEQLADLSRQSQGNRIAAYLNWKIFYGMGDEWVADTDLLLHQLPITGAGFKKVSMGPRGLQSDYISPLNLTVHANTKSMDRCPRITHDFEMYPHEITQAQRSGRFRDVDLSQSEQDQDEEAPRQIIEQLCMRDLDGDGMKEPYLVTIDVESQELLRIEPSFSHDDIMIDPKRGRVTEITRWNPYPNFTFFPDPKGNFYGTGFAKLLEPISDSIDTAINQMFDAATAQNAGGGFISSNIRLRGSGQGGALWFQPGQYQVVDAPGEVLKDGIWSRTLPEYSPVMMQLLEVMIEFAKDIASIKDVATGDSSTMAPVGTTYAVQQQALQVFSSIYKRVHQGFKREFALMFECLKRFASDRERAEYQLITGGDLDADIQGNAEDVIQPVSDPTVVTKIQKLSRIQAMQQFAESPIGQAAGMGQPAAAQALALEIMEAMEIERPERFIGPVAPNPLAQAEAQAKVQVLQAKAQLDQQNATKSQAAASLDHAKTVREVGLAAIDTEEAHRASMSGPDPSDALKVSQTHKSNADVGLTHAKTIRELALAHSDMNPPDETDAE